MKNTKGKFICTTAIAAVAAALAVVALALVGFNVVFASENIARLAFQGEGKFAIMLSVGCVCGALLFVVALVLVLAKKKPAFVLPAFLALIGIVGGLMALTPVRDIKASLSEVYVILAGVAGLLGLIAMILSIVFGLSGKKEATIVAEEPVAGEKAEEPVAEETKEEPKQEEAVVAIEPAKEEKSEEPVKEEPKQEEPVAEEAAPVEEEMKALPAKKAKAKKSAANAIEPEAKEEAPEEKPAEGKAEESVADEKSEEPVAEESAPETAEEAAPVEEEPAVAAAPKAKAKESKVVGKYEVFPEAGFFKYRLKANNGEILIVSNGYKTREGAKAGIATLKKNVPGGTTKIITDKNGYSQFRIFTANDSRLVVAGEIYPTAVNAQNALNSVERFYDAKKIVDLDEIPEEEVREWTIDFAPVTPTKNGKVEVSIDEETKKWIGQLIASNGAVLFVTSTYSSKNAVLSAIEKVKAKVLAGSMTISRDKQNRYQFKVFSDNGAVMIMGETYPSKDSAISAATSVRNFIGDAKLIDTTKAAE